MDAHRYLARDVSDVRRPDVILPSQYFGVPRTLTPEQRLGIAVLNNAIHSVQKYRLAIDRRGRRLFNEVNEWMLDGETSWPYSFERICAVLDLDANAVRQRLRLGAERPPGDAGISHVTTQTG
jgi:hypothetical protein